MSTQDQATGRPWKIGERWDHGNADIEILSETGRETWIVARMFADPKEGVQEANAALIVRAVNSHDALIEALEFARNELSGSPRPDYVMKAIVLADKALTLAKGGEA